jgi:UV DNA damage endonuclease
MIRLGFAVRVLGQKGLRAADLRRWQQQPHLSVSLIYLRDIIVYLAQQQIGCYRVADALAPYLTHGAHAEFERQIEECAGELAAVGALAQAMGVRLSMHLGAHVTLAAEDSAQARRAAAEVVAQASLLDALGMPPEAVLVLHVGGGSAEGAVALQRFAERYRLLPEHARRRVVLEHDDHGWSLEALLPLHEVCGVPLVFDALHHRLSPGRLALGTALGLALATWPAGVRPKVHFSSQRTEGHLGPRGGGVAVLPPKAGQHADYINPFEFALFVEQARGLPAFDVMLEAKAGDLALLRLREELQRYALAAVEKVW